MNERWIDQQRQYILSVSDSFSLHFLFLWFSFCLASSVSLALFPTVLPLSRWVVGGGWRAWMEEWVGSPVVLTAPDRAVLMGADDD